MPRALETRATCSAALAGLIWGSRPLPERVTASMGIATSAASHSLSIFLCQLSDTCKGFVNVSGFRDHRSLRL